MAQWDFKLPPLPGAPYALAMAMKRMLMILAVFLTQAFAADEAKPADPLMPADPFAGRAAAITWPDLPVSKIDLKRGDSVSDALKQIDAGLPPEGRRAIVLDIPDARFATMKLRSDLRLRNAQIGIVLRYLEQISPVGSKLRDNAWHIGAERADDIVMAEYMISKRSLKQLGIVFVPGQLFRTTQGQMWPPNSSWKATYSFPDPDDKKGPNRENLWRSKTGVLRVLAARSYQEEIGAVILLQARGYDKITLEHPAGQQ